MTTGNNISLTHFKCNSVWNANREISCHSEDFIWNNPLECKIMRNFMDCKEQIVVRRPSYDVGRQYEPQRERACMTEPYGQT